MGETITLDGVEYVRADSVDLTPSATQIVVAQRGWVFVGRVSEVGDEVVISDAQNIRRWGTSRGLGELVRGPLADTKVDPCGTVRVHRLAVVARLDVEGDAWERS